MLPSRIPAPTSFENVFAGKKSMGYLPMRALQCCKALMFLALAGLEAKANRDSCMARPTACAGGLGQNRRILVIVHHPWTQQPRNLSLETQETSMESSYCSQAKRAVSSSRRRLSQLRSILIRGRGVAGELVPPGVSADLAGVSLPKSGGCTTRRHSSGEK